MDLAASKSNPLAGTGVDFTNGDGDEKGIFSGKMQLDDERSSIVDDMRNHRRLTGRQIQLLAIAGTIGTCCGFFADAGRSGSCHVTKDPSSHPSARIDGADALHVAVHDDARIHLNPIRC